MGSLGFETPKKKAMWLYPKVLGFNPSERWGHSACSSQGLVYVFGGCCGGLHFSDVLTLNLDTMAWSTLTTIGQGPGLRDSHSAVLLGQKMIVFGGTNGSKKINDLHILDLMTKEWSRPECKGTPPSPRESHTATLIGNSKIVIFGGSGEGEANYLNDLHVLDFKTMAWTSPEMKGDIPVPRDSHSAVAIGNKLFVYGGDRGDRYNGDVDMLDMDTLTWSRVAVQGFSPRARAGHAAVNSGTKVYIIGGVGDKHYNNDVWVLDVSSCSWTQLDVCGQKPQGRFSHTAVATGSDITIYGGCGEDERPLNELLILQLGAEHPNGRYNISMCKIIGKHWNQERRRFAGGTENNLRSKFYGKNEVLQKGAHQVESESIQSYRLISDSSHPKRKRISNSKVWEAESEQEEHSLSLSQHSSPSQSDQEQTTVRKTADSIRGMQGLHLLKQFNQNPTRCQPNHAASNQKEDRNTLQITPQDLQFLREHQKHALHVQCPLVGQASRQGMQFLKPLEAGPIHSLVGADVRGKVDGAFDSGLLMTATVDGKIFRGVLFAPGAGSISKGGQTSTQNAVALPLSNTARLESLRPMQQSFTTSMPESGQNNLQTQVSRPYHQPVIRANQSLGKDPKSRSDLQGLVLTLGGPGRGL
ncbi:Galactose oxidase/kelch repeat superfamily protein putative isoform 2 [Tripterygium wilfordii]|uniref:Galactose oxidase/kelch repeat superfamily protein putative isoform 2 n=1 Tax=Tripterygium wilfordii TaxID=458696 RepID=A0A7J7DK43_TRIWF|nr:RING finger protein B-like [Tripterygium wilfordii]KAF5746701.1 Galactose oxidase/kelch repeat superfamily protein putative isoform 2 [Tripterygium wilfordii]